VIGDGLEKRRVDDFDAAWLRQAERPGNPAAWNGVDRCDRPAKGRAKCAFAGRPHRHCECGLPIDLDHGYCDNCMAALLRGVAMTEYQSQQLRAVRQAWLLKYDFVEFDAMGLHVVRQS
jgi:predicted nucleic acid-binding Zn ribbon protein